MARLTGKNLSVTVGGSTASYSLGWSADWSPQTAEHNGAGMEMPRLKVAYTRVTGSFECESNPADSVQAALIGDAVEASIVLYESNSTSHNLGTCLVSGGVRVNRSGKSVRQFRFMQQGG